MVSRLKKIAAGLAFTCFCLVIGYGQPNSNTSFSASNSSNSDYAITLNWTYNSSYCDCSQSTNLNVSGTQSGGNTPPSNFLGTLSSGTSQYIAGPGQSINLNWSFHFTGRRQWTGDGCTVFATCIADCNCDYTFTGSGVTASTAAVKAPTGVTATDNEYDTQVVINWSHATSIPHSLHSYRIYRDNSLITTVSGSMTTYTDTGLMPGDTSTYAVTTYVPSSSFGLAHESSKTASGAFDEGSTFSVGLQASDGEYFNRSKLTWHNISDIADDIRIERSIHGSSNKEELAILNPNATNYNDQGGIPGYNYTYYVTPLSDTETFLTDSDPGYSKPNGSISGHVLSPLGAGVSDVNIFIELVTTSIPAGGASLPVGCTATYCATTDASGYYEVEEIFYFTEAEFRIYPQKGTTTPHVFTPDTLYRTLNENAKSEVGVDFTDETVITVGGRVAYPPNPSSNDTCGVKDVRILIDGQDLGIRTDAQGYWSTALNDEGMYDFDAELFDHDYRDTNGDSTITMFINADELDINWENKTTRTIEVVAQGGCMASLGDSVGIQVTSPSNCYNKTYYTDANGLLTIDDLPPRDYSVTLISIDPVTSNHSNIMDQIGNKPVDIDLTELDTMLIVTENDSMQITPADTTILPNMDTVITPADTMMVTYQDTSYTTEKLVRYIYRSPIIISVDFEAAGAELSMCQNSEGDDIVVMEQGISYPLQFEVKELLGNDCYIDTGTLVIYDEISDREGSGVRIPISGGIATYIVDAGNPDIAESANHNHEKFLYVVPDIDFADADPADFWVLVTGIKSNTPSFITRTPEIPQVVIHDPPGDNSYAFVEEGTSITTFSSTEVQVGGDAGLYVNLKGGPQAKIFSAKIGAGGLLEFSAKAGRDNFDRDGVYNTITFLQNFSTSSAETFVGNEGDVFIGSALNQTFALSQELTFNGTECASSVDTIVEMGFSDFATTFIYTEYHVKNTLIPTLDILKSLADTTTESGRMEYNDLLADRNMWANILSQNSLHRDSLAEFDENISVSAGATVAKTYTSSRGAHNSFTYNTFFDASLKVGAYVEVDAPSTYLSLEGGVMANFRWSQTEVRDTMTDTTRTVGYVIADNDIGDFLSIDILNDTINDIPAFRLVSGTSSCPNEDGTQPRDVPTVGIFPPVVNNVPFGDEANFTLSISNLSESGEMREYAVRVISATNPDGASVRVAGSLINSGASNYFLAPNQTLDLAMTVTRGPIASVYENIGIMIYPPCEYAIWQDGGVLKNADTVYFDVNWTTPCSNISLSLPYDNWLVNQNSNNILHAAFTGYDIDNPYLESMTLQIKREGQGYINQVTIPVDSIIGPFYDVLLDVTTFPDGNYTVRAKANCGAFGTTYSSEIPGRIDRTSLAPFGTPTPSDGFLREGQEVSVSFDKVINCDFGSYDDEPVITLIREDTGEEIPFTTSCFQNKVIINTNPPLIEQNDLDGVLVTAKVNMLQDMSGNAQEVPTEWSFLVNVSPVFWDPDPLIASGFEGKEHIITGQLKNTSTLSKAFSLHIADAPALIDYPDWLTPLQTRGTVLSENSYDVEFAVDPNLTPGIYTGQVVAMVDSLPVSMEVIFELLAKPVNWPFNPNDYQYSMNVVAQFSLNSSDTLLSTDTRDLIGAFVNGEIRGVTNIEYLPDLDKYLAYLTIYSNDQGGSNGETVSFRFWHALNGVEYGAMETLTFTLDNNVGSPSNPFLLHPEGFFQIIPLNKGWNWISFNVMTNDMSREHIFQELLSPHTGNDIIIKSQAKTSQYSYNTGWQGNLQTLELGVGYLLYLSNEPDTLKVVGFPPASTINVSVNGAWNWIGFPRLNPEPVNDVLATLNPGQDDILKSQYRFSKYDGGLGSWLGNLNFLEPGEGYKLYLSNPGVISFDPSRSDGYELDPSHFEYNMNVTGVVDMDLIDEDYPEDLLIGAFIDDRCHGVAKLEYVEAVNDYRAYMLVHGNAEDLSRPIKFMILNETTGDEYLCNGEELSFVADGIQGKTAEPYPFLLTTTSVDEQGAGRYYLAQSSPNPTNGLAEIWYQIPDRDRIIITLTDVTGHRVLDVVDAMQPAGQHKASLDLHGLARGIYFYTMTSGEFSQTRKLILK